MFSVKFIKTNASLKICFLLIMSILFLDISAQTTQSLWVGQKYKCDATSATFGSITDISWSSNGGYISLSGSGLYRDVIATQYWSGTASVTCSWKYTLYYGDKPERQSKTWYFTCNENPVSISPKDMELVEGETGRVYYSLKYSNSYSNYAKPYLSCTSNCISVTQEGIVTAISPGVAYINVFCKLSDASNAPYCKVTVKEKIIDPTSIELDPQTLKIPVGEKGCFTCKLLPKDAKTVLTWDSSDESIATVDSKGNVKAISVGEAKITVSTKNGLKATGKIIVTPAVSKIEIIDQKIYEGFTIQLVPLITPSGVETKLTWSSSNTKIATVDKNGKVTALQEGSAQISVKTENNCVGKATITVIKAPENENKKSISVRHNVLVKLINKSLK